MKYENIMISAKEMFSDRGVQYGDMESTLQRQAKIATLILGKSITAYDVAMVMHAVKLGRLEGSRNKADTYIDGVNYLAFAASFATADDTMDDDIANIVRRFAPKRGNLNVENSGDDNSGNADFNRTDAPPGG